MTSKEALKELKENAQEVCKWELDRLNIIEKDLDRLDKLEKSIEILKRVLLVNVKECRGIYYAMGYDTNEHLTKEEYELLKVVLENDSNKRIH